MRCNVCILVWEKAGISYKGKREENKRKKIEREQKRLFLFKDKNVEKHETERNDAIRTTITVVVASSSHHHTSNTKLFSGYFPPRFRSTFSSFTLSCFPILNKE